MALAFSVFLFIHSKYVQFATSIVTTVQKLNSARGRKDEWPNINHVAETDTKKPRCGVGAY